MSRFVNKWFSLVRPAYAVSFFNCPFIVWTDPRLPTDLHNDPKTLWTLLLVDCFFFHATVSLLYASPFKFVQQDNRHKPLRFSSPPVSTTSVISQSPTSIKPEQPFTAAGLLSRFEPQFVGGSRFRRCCKILSQESHQRQQSTMTPHG